MLKKTIKQIRWQHILIIIAILVIGLPSIWTHFSLSDDELTRHSIKNTNALINAQWGETFETFCKC